MTPNEKTLQQRLNNVDVINYGSHTGKIMWKVIKDHDITQYQTI